LFNFSLFILQALSINRSLSGAKSAAENGQVNCRELRNLVIQAVNSAGGRIDYPAVPTKPSALPWFFFFFFFFLAISGSSLQGVLGI
jgi:hypothetical protein